MSTQTSISDGRPCARRGSILVVGVGALGCPALAALSRSPIARLTFMDHDRVELSNLPPQPLYDRSDIGRLKVAAAADRLAGCGAELQPVAAALTETNAVDLIRSHDFVIDACDDPPTKFLINRVAVTVGRPFCYAGLSRTGGLALTIVPGVTACLACVFPDPVESVTDHAAAGSLGCHETGILTPVAAVLGSYQALAALATLGLRPRQTPGRLRVYQLRGRRWRSIDATRNPRCTVCAEARTTDNTRRSQPCHS